MTRYGMIIDLERCIGCNACTIACKQKHATLPGVFWTKVNVSEEGTYPHAFKKFLPTQCNHCENPTCMHVCPTGATYKREDGLVLVDQDKCIGCRYCMAACPYEARSFDFGDHSGYFPEIAEKTAYEKAGDADRVKGTVTKCKFCSDRIDANSPLKNGVPVTACAQVCPTSARIFGDLDSPEMQKCVKEGAYQPRPDQRTNPNIYYLPK